MKDLKMNLYEVYNRLTYFEVKEMFKKAKNSDERNFFMAIANSILQREQSKVIGE